MSLYEKFENLKFTKSVAGYTVKEIDAFLAEVIPLVKEQDQTIVTLRASLDVYENKTEEIARLESEAYKLLEAAKSEGQRIVDAANAEAQKIHDEARISAEADIRVAALSAKEHLAKAEQQAKERIDDATQNAKKIISLADVKGREMLAESKAKYDEQIYKASELSKEYEAFEQKFKNIVADTAKALAALKEKSVLPKTEIVSSAVEARSEVESLVKEPEPAAVAEPLPEPEVEVELEVETVEVSDVSFVGGKPIVTSQDMGKKTRRLYDTVQVTYDSEEDDFDDVKAIMREGKAKTRKSPTHFSE